MFLTKEEEALIQRRRSDERRRKGHVDCWSCGGTGSASQSDCGTCEGRGWFIKNAPEVNSRLKRLRASKRSCAKAYDLAIKALL